MSTAVALDRPRSHVADRRRGGQRADIQALRALAVLGVLVYHLWPGTLPGGFVGVDVFFVISGFLITGQLLRTPPSSGREFASFWARRIIRLLPPVFVVIFATLGAAVVFLPSAQWAQMAREAVTSMFYAQNWQLISAATDYLDAHRALSPFQHFWSLSVEEQYYIGWPFLVASLTWFCLRMRTNRSRTVLIGFGGVAALSLVVSVVQTSTAPAAAYFSTWTRMWELAVGSLLAAVFTTLAPRFSVHQRVALLWLGLAGICVAYLQFTAGTPFPGYAALLPTLSTALVILANDPRHPVNPRLITRAATTQLIGDCSYALYLWHWPLIIIAPYVLDRELGTVDKLVIVVLAVLAAWLSTTLLEMPIRRSAFLRARLRRAFLLGTALSGVVLLSSLSLKAYVDRQVAETDQKIHTAMQTGKHCFGAAAMQPKSGCEINGAKLLTSPAFAKADITSGIRECLNWPPFPKKPISCTRGDSTDPVKRIALFGNSHAGQWTEALDQLGRDNHWRIDTYVMGACYSSVDQPSQDCTRIVGQAIDRIVTGRYDAVVMATADPEHTTIGMYERTIDTFTASGAHVLVIRDTPAPWDESNPVPDCVGRHLSDVKACSGTPDVWIRPDRLTLAAERMTSADVSSVDLNDHLCTKTNCPAVIGGVIVFSDFNHLSRTFSRTLAPYLEPAVKAALR
jgi:peptidoglycan/LPS O-acetylase OafA/YrhL